MYKIRNNKLKFTDNFNEPLSDEIYTIMEKVEEIVFGRDFNQFIQFPILPNIKYITFGFDFNQLTYFTNLTGLIELNFWGFF